MLGASGSAPLLQLISRVRVHDFGVSQLRWFHSFVHASVGDDGALRIRDVRMPSHDLEAVLDGLAWNLCIAPIESLYETRTSSMVLRLEAFLHTSTTEQMLNRTAAKVHNIVPSHAHMCAGDCDKRELIYETSSRWQLRWAARSGVRLWFDVTRRTIIPALGSVSSEMSLLLIVPFPMFSLRRGACRRSRCVRVNSSIS